MRNSSINTRRHFIAKLIGSAGAILVGDSWYSASLRASVGRVESSAQGWSSVPDILNRIKEPIFPNRNFSITHFGAKGDANTDCTAAIADAIQACNKAGGGRVIVPAGTYLTGAIHLLSNVRLHIERHATLKFSRDPAHYLPVVLTRWEGIELMNYSPFIYALNQSNIAITGEGTIDGQADCDNWWSWRPSDNCKASAGTNQKRDRDELFGMGENGVRVPDRIFGDGHYLRPQFIQPYRCKNVLIEGITLRNSPMWQIHPVLCSNVIVRRVNIISHGPNNDGCDPESCRDVLIDRCFFDTGDDCIAIKSGRNADGRRIAVPTENVIIQNCRMKDGHGGVTIGSEISGGVRNVYIRNCRMDSPSLDRALRFKNNAMRGGVVEHVYAKDIDVGQVSDSIVSIDFTYEEGAVGGFKPVVRDVRISNVRSKRSKYALYFKGLDRAPITEISLENCTFDDVKEKDIVENVKGLSLRNVRVNGKQANLERRVQSDGGRGYAN